MNLNYLGNGKKVAMGFVLVSTLGVTAEAWTGEDSLISLSYWEEVFRPDMEETLIKGSFGVTDKLYNTMIGEIQGLSHELALFEDEQMDYRPVIRACSQGEELTLEQGSVIVALDGILKLSHDGAVVNLSTGMEEPAEGELEVGQQYLVAENTEAKVVVQSEKGSASLLGRYSVGATTVVESDFLDVSVNDWFFASVNFVCEHTLFAGTSSESFSPYLTMDRAMMMAVLFRLAGSPQREMESATATFLDVDKSEWYEPYVRWGASQQITAGVGDRYFAPTETVTRQQVLVMLCAFARDYLGMDVSEVADISGFYDADSVAVWAESSVAWAVQNQLMQDIPSSSQRLLADVVASRAEVATMLRNFYTNFGLGS